jgi:hypothetical protein
MTASTTGLPHVKRGYLQLGAGVVVTLFGLISVGLSLSERLFFSMFVGDLVTEIQSAPIGEATVHLMNSLIANGRISYLEMHTKIALACAGFLLMYVGMNWIASFRGSDFSLKALFTKDYWIKFNAFKYRKTKINVNIVD